MLLSGWSRFFHWIPPVFFPIPFGSFQMHHLQLQHNHPHVTQLSLFPCKVQVLVSLFTFLNFHFVVLQYSKFPLSLLIITWSGCLAGIRWSVCILKFPTILYVLFSRKDSGLSMIFVTASHQTGLDTRSKARRPIKVGIKGRRRSETSRDSNPASHWPTKFNVGRMKQAVSRT